MWWAIALIIVAGLVGLAFLLNKHIKELREKRIAEHEYSAAMTLWQFAALVKREIDEMARLQTGVLDFARITVPHAPGYRLSIELAGYGFHIHAVPETYNRSGRLSFYIDNELTVRAADHQGDRATPGDPEYQGESDDAPVN